MSDLSIRMATSSDLPRLQEIYNHYVVHTAITFDLEPVTLENRRAWFSQFAPLGRYRLWVAECDRRVQGYASSHSFRPRRAYETTVEPSVYCAPDGCGRGIGRALYTALFAGLADEDIHAYVAGITLPNEASVRLHARFGFTPVGIMHSVGRKFGTYWDVGWYEKLRATP